MVHDEATGDRVPPQVYDLEGPGSQQCAASVKTAPELPNEGIGRLEARATMGRGHNESTMLTFVVCIGWNNVITAPGLLLLALRAERT